MRERNHLFIGRMAVDGRQRLGTLLLLLLLPFAVTEGQGVNAGRGFDLPDIGSSAAATLSLEEERRLGEAFMREARKRLQMVDDPAVNLYIRSLGNRMGSQADGGRFHLFVVSDPAINAFAAPGGYIGIHSGLLLASTSEDELAAVIAHEMAHVTQRHIARAIDSSRRLSLPYQAALLAGVLLASKSSELGQAALIAAQAGMVQQQIDFTRENEHEADHVGMQILSRSGFDPEGMPSFFERLASANRFQRQPPPFLSTHPVTVERIAESRDRASRLLRDSGHEPGPYYYLIRARLEWLESREPRSFVDQINRRVTMDSDQSAIADHYALALAYSRIGEHALARRSLAIVQSRFADLPLIIDAGAAIERAAGNHQDSIGISRSGLGLYPDDRLITIGLATTLLEMGRPGEAREVLLPLLRREEGDPALRMMLAHAAERVGLKQEAFRHLAEHYYLNGEIDLAIRQLENSLELKGGDLNERASAAARLRSLQSEKIELKE